MKTTGMLQVLTAATALGMYAGSTHPRRRNRPGGIGGNGPVDGRRRGHAAGSARVTAREAAHGKVVQEAAVDCAEGQYALDLPCGRAVRP